MPAVLRVRDKDGNVIDIPSIKGANGKSAYQSAIDGGYNGTEEEFNSLLANIGVTTERPTEIIAGVTTDYFLATSSYSNFVSLYLFENTYEGHEIKNLWLDIDGTRVDVKNLSAFDGNPYVINMDKLITSLTSGLLHVVTMYSPTSTDIIDRLVNLVGMNFELEIYK